MLLQMLKPIKNMKASRLEEMRKNGLIFSQAKLTIFEVLVSKISSFTTLPAEPKEICSNVFSVQEYSINFDSNSNLRSFGYCLLLSIFEKNNQNNGEILFDRIVEELIKLQNDKPIILNCPFQRKFSFSDLLEIIPSMFKKIIQLTNEGFNINQILEAYPGYLQLIVIFLRSILCRVRYGGANDFLESVPTVDIYAILTEYFDINCLVKKGQIFIFPNFGVLIHEKSKMSCCGKYFKSQKQMRKQEEKIKQRIKMTVNKQQSMKRSHGSYIVSQFSTQKTPISQFGILPSVNELSEMVEKYQDNVKNSKKLEDSNLLIIPSRFPQKDSNEAGNMVLVKKKKIEKEEVYTPNSQNILHYIGNNDSFFLNNESMERFGSQKKFNPNKFLKKNKKINNQNFNFDELEEAERSSHYSFNKVPVKNIHINSNVYSFTFQKKNPIKIKQNLLKRPKNVPSNIKSATNLSHAKKNSFIGALEKYKQNLNVFRSPFQIERVETQPQTYDLSWEKEKRSRMTSRLNTSKFESNFFSKRNENSRMPAFLKNRKTVEHQKGDFAINKSRIIERNKSNSIPKSKKRASQFLDLNKRRTANIPKSSFPQSCFHQNTYSTLQSQHSTFYEAVVNIPNL